MVSSSPDTARNSSSDFSDESFQQPIGQFKRPGYNLRGYSRRAIPLLRFGSFGRIFIPRGECDDGTADGRGAADPAVSLPKGSSLSHGPDASEKKEKQSPAKKGKLRTHALVRPATERHADYGVPFSYFRGRATST